VPCAQFCLYVSGLSLCYALCPILPVCLWIFFVLCLVSNSACMSLDCLCAVSCGWFCLYVFGFSLCCVLCSILPVCLWIVFCNVYHFIILLFLLLYLPCLDKVNDTTVLGSFIVIEHWNREINILSNKLIIKI
jgi:hypothetical protein